MYRKLAVTASNQQYNWPLVDKSTRESKLFIIQDTAFRETVR